MRRGKRIAAFTEPGKAVLAIAERILAEAANLKRAGEEFANEKLGTLTVATTHTQACYALPKAVSAFKKRYPKVRLVLHQGNPTQICEMVIAGEADLAIATESIAQYPVVTYDFAFAGRSQINKAFEKRGLAPNVVLTALDSDVIKTYVGLGLGIGILATMGFDAKHDRGLHALDASYRFESSTTRLGIKRGAWLRGYVFEFIELFAPRLSQALVEKTAMEKKGSKYEL